MRFLRRSLAGLFLLGLTVGLLAAAALVMMNAVQETLARDNGPAPARERVVAARVMTLEPGTVTPVLVTFGEVRSRRTLDLRAPVGGRIVALAEGFEDGGTLAEGQLVMRVDQDYARAAVAIARNDLALAEVEVADAVRALALSRDELAASEAQAELRQRALDRRENLAARGVGADAAVEEAELALSAARQAVVARRQAIASAEARQGQAEADLERRRIALAEAERRLADTELHAAFAGVLSEVAAVEGGLVSTNERIGLLIDPHALEVSFRLSTAQYARLLDARGEVLPAAVEIALDVMGAEIATAGRLTRVGAAVAQGQTGRLLYAELEAARGFRPGDFVEVRVREPVLEGVAEIPATAVDASGTVLLLGEGDRLRAAPVEVLRRQGDAVVIRVDEALAGREIVTERSPLLGDGIRIRPVRPGQPMGEGTRPPAPQADAAGGGPVRAASIQATPDVPDAQGRIPLTPERRAALIAFVEQNTRMPPEVRARMLAELREELVAAETVARLEARMGG